MKPRVTRRGGGENRLAAPAHAYQPDDSPFLWRLGEPRERLDYLIQLLRTAHFERNGQWYIPGVADGRPGETELGQDLFDGSSEQHVGNWRRLAQLGTDPSASLLDQHPEYPARRRAVHRRGDRAP